MANATARRLRKTMTPQEVKLWVHLRQWRRQHAIHFRRQVPRLGYVLDFACLPERLVVEVDGGLHGFDANSLRDVARDARLAADGFRVLRFWNREVDRNLVGVLDTILHAVKERTPPTALRAVPPPRTGEG